MTGFDPSTMQQGGEQQGAPPTDTASRLKERDWLQWRFAQVQQAAILELKAQVAQQLMAGQQELAEDTFPADPASQAEWMTGTRIGMADKTLSPQRLERRIMGAPDEIQQELAGALQAEKAMEGIRKLGGVYGKQRGAQAASMIAAPGRGFLDAVTFARDDSRVLYDLAKRFAETGEVPRAAGGPESESWLKDQLRKLFGEDMMQVIRPPEDVLPRERQGEEFLEGAKKAYAEESGKSFKLAGVDLANVGQKAGGLAGIIMGPGGAMLKAGRMAAVKGASAVLGKSVGARAATAFGWAGATVAGGGFESIHPLDGDDQAVVDKIRKERGDKAAEEAEGSLQSIRFLKGMATWGTIEALGIPLGKVGTAGGMRVPGLAAGAKRAAAGAASGAALEPASALGDLPPFQEMYRQVTGKDPKLKTAVARAYKVQVDPKATTGEKVEAWKQAAGHMAIDAVMLGALHMASAASSVLPPSQKAQAQEVRSILAKEARAELDAKTDLPREEINRLVPSPEERPVDVPLAGRPETFQEAQAARRREQITSPERQEELGRGALEMLMASEGGESIRAVRQPAVGGSEGGTTAGPAPQTEKAPGTEARNLRDAERRAQEASEARKAEPEAVEPARQEAIAEERRFIAEKQKQATEEGHTEAADALEAYSRKFEDESRDPAYVPRPEKRPTVIGELGKTPKDPALLVRRELGVSRADKTIAQKLKKHYGMQANEARKLIEKERGGAVLRETQEQDYREAEGLPIEKARQLKEGIAEGTKFRFRDLFDGRELTVRKNTPGGVLEVSDGDRLITVMPEMLQRIDPKSIVRPEPAPTPLPPRPAAPEAITQARPEALEVPWTVKKGGKPVPVRVRHEEGTVYADVILGKGDRHRFKGDSLAAVEAQVRALAEKRGLEMTAASDVGTKASEAARAQEVIAQHEAAKVEGERAKAQEAREKAGQERSPEGVDALVKALRAMPRAEAMEKLRSLDPQQQADVRKFSAEHPEAGVVNVGEAVHAAMDLIVGPPRGLKDPRGRESPDQLRSVYMGTRPLATYKDATDRFLATTLNVGHGIGDHLRNIGMVMSNRRGAIQREIIERLEPAMRKLPREEDGNALAFNWLDRHAPGDIKALDTWAAANGYDPAKVTEGLHAARDEFRAMRVEMNRSNPAYINAASRFRWLRREWRKGGHSAKQRKLLEEQIRQQATLVDQLRNAGYEEYAHRVFTPEHTSAFGGKVRKIVDKKDAAPTQKIHRAMRHRTGAEGYEEDVFISVDRYFMGMVDAIESTKALRQLDPLVNGRPKRIGQKHQAPGGEWVDPLETRRPGEQYRLGESIGGDEPPKGIGGTNPSEAAKKAWGSQILEWVKWDKEEGIATLRRFDTKEEVYLPENLARSLYRKEGGLLSLARMRSSTSWRADMLNKWMDKHILGHWVDRDWFDRRVASWVRAAQTHTVLGAMLGNVTKTPLKAFALGHFAGMSDAGAAGYIHAMQRYLVDPRLRQLVKESGAANTGMIDTHAFSQKRVFRGKVTRALETTAKANLALLREGEKLTRQAAAAHGILEMEAWAKRNNVKIRKRDLYEAASVAAMRAQGNFDAVVAGTMFTGRHSWIAKTALQFQRPAMAFFDTVLTRAMKQRDFKPLGRAMVYGAVLAGLYRWVSASLFGTEHDIMQDAGVTVGETPASDYLEKKVGKWVKDVVLIPGWPTNSFSESPITWETGKNFWESGIIQRLFGSPIEARPELAAEALSGTVFGPQVKRLRQFASMRQVKGVGHENEVDLPHAATVGEALNPIAPLTGQSGQRMPKEEAFWRMFLPGTAERSTESMDIREKLKAIGEESKDTSTRQMQAFLNMRRANREGRTQDAEVFKAEYLQLKAQTGRASDITRAIEAERWEKLPPEVRILAHSGKEARLQMVAEILDSGAYGDATKRDVIRAVERGEEPYEGTRAETRAKYRAAKSKILAKKEGVR